MDEKLGALTVVGTVLLRLGVPLAITIGIVQLFRRLDIRWQKQDWGHWSARLDKTGGEAGRNWLSRLANPCWNENGCEESAMAKCAAHSHQTIPCWMARRAMEGGLPEKCLGCERYTMGSLVTAS